MLVRISSFVRITLCIKKSLSETSPGTRVNANRHITVRKITPAWSVPEGLPRFVYIAWAPFKAIFMAFQLAWIMGCITQRPNYILIQVRHA